MPTGSVGVSLCIASTMNIYIDESGTFANPQNRKHTISTVAALVVPETQLVALEAGFQDLKESWGTPEQEVKGSKLDEDQVSAVIKLLTSFDVILELAVVDLGLSVDDNITAHKHIQADKLSEHIDPQRSPILAENTRLLQEKLKGISNPLYVQSWLVVQVIWRAVQTSTIYFCQRIPNELENFNWIVDAKDRDRIAYEEYWLTVIAAFTQTMSIQDPFIMLDEGDYSAFKKYYRPVPDYLLEHVPDLDTQQSHLDATRIFKESLTFVDSRDNCGIQLADILATTFRRALVNNLQERGWSRLGELMLYFKNTTVQFIGIGRSKKEQVQELPYHHKLNHIHKSARSPFL